MKPLPRTPSSAGFTLTELMLAMVLAVILTSMALSSMISTAQVSTRLQQRLQVEEETRLLSEYLADGLRTVGGGMARPWSAVYMENNLSGTGSDRLTVAKLEDDAWQCQIDTFPSNWLNATVNSDGTCCIRDEFVNRQGIVITGEGDRYSHWKTYKVMEVDTDACRMRLDASVAALLSNPPASVNTWIGGSFSIVKVMMLEHDQANRTLLLWRDRDLNGTLESTVVADRVFDLQFALGYDVPDWDWRVNDTASNGDEWLFNATGDTFRGTTGQGLDAARYEDLRMLKIGVAVGTPRNDDPGNSLRLLDGPTRQADSWLLEGQVTTIVLRNYEIMR